MAALFAFYLFAVVAVVGAFMVIFARRTRCIRCCG